MDKDQGRTWRQYAREALSPDAKAPRLPREAFARDAVLALGMAGLALYTALQVHIGQRIVGMEPATAGHPATPIMGPVPPELRDYACILLAALPLVARRRFPLVTFWMVLCATLADLNYTTAVSALACLVASYSAIVHSRSLVPAMGSFALGAVFATSVFREPTAVQSAWSTPIVVLLIAALIASVARYWQLRLKASQQRLAELQKAQEESMHRAVQEERSRIAGELHDVVTHNVSVMVIQAGAARKIMDTAPDQSKEALLAVEAGGRAAMAELRHVMGLLAPSGTGRSSGRSDDGQPDRVNDELEPQPGLDQLGALVERVRAAGVSVSVAMSPPADLPPGISLAAYRVVQEALTNTLKHAVGANSSVTVGHHNDWLQIEVTNSAGRPGIQSAGGSGRGLIGMRERLGVYGGTLEAGPRPGGGYRISARIPWKAA